MQSKVTFQSNICQMEFEDNYPEDTIKTEDTLIKCDDTVNAEDTSVNNATTYDDNFLIERFIETFGPEDEDIKSLVLKFFIEPNFEDGCDSYLRLINRYENEKKLSILAHIGSVKLGYKRYTTEESETLIFQVAKELGYNVIITETV